MLYKCARCRKIAEKHQGKSSCPNCGYRILYKVRESEFRTMKIERKGIYSEWRRTE